MDPLFVCVRYAATRRGLSDANDFRRKAKDELDALKSELGEDEIARGEKELDVLTRQHVELIDDALKRKEAELLEV